MGVLSYAALEGLASDPRSGVAAVHKSVQLVMENNHSGDIKESIVKKLNSNTNKYYPDAGGIMMGYHGIKLLRSSSEVTNIVCTRAKFYVFSPKVGSELQCTVSRKEDLVTCLVHGLFEVQLVNPDSQAVFIGQTVTVKVDAVEQLAWQEPRIVGTLLEKVGDDITPCIDIVDNFEDDEVECVTDSVGNNAGSEEQITQSSNIIDEGDGSPHLTSRKRKMSDTSSAAPDRTSSSPVKKRNKKTMKASSCVPTNPIAAAGPRRLNSKSSVDSETSPSHSSSSEHNVDTYRRSGRLKERDESKKRNQSPTPRSTMSMSPPLAIAPDTNNNDHVEVPPSPGPPSPVFSIRPDSRAVSTVGGRPPSPSLHSRPLSPAGSHRSITMQSHSSQHSRHQINLDAPRQNDGFGGSLASTGQDILAGGLFEDGSLFYEPPPSLPPSERIAESEFGDNDQFGCPPSSGPSSSGGSRPATPLDNPVVAPIDGEDVLAPPLSPTPSVRSTKSVHSDAPRYRSTRSCAASEAASAHIESLAGSEFVDNDQFGGPPSPGQVVAPIDGEDVLAPPLSPTPSVRSTESVHSAAPSYRSTRLSVQDDVGDVMVDAMSHACHLCNKKYKTRSAVYRHIYYIHSPLVTCDLCGKSGMSRIALFNHKRAPQCPTIQ